MEPRRDHHNRSGFRRQRPQRPGLGLDQGGARKPRAFIAENAVRLGGFPPSVNRLIGLRWLAKILYPDKFPEDMRTLTRDFYTMFYHRTPDDAQIDHVLAGRD